MARIKCSTIVKDRPNLASLLLYLEKEVLVRHCCEGQSLRKIANDLGLSSSEVRSIHERAPQRLAWAVAWLMRDVGIDQLRMSPTAILLEIREGAEVEEGSIRKRVDRIEVGAAA